MATFYEYKCKGCGYTVNANPKGKDMVMMGDNDLKNGVFHTSS